MGQSLPVWLQTVSSVHPENLCKIAHKVLWPMPSLNAYGLCRKSQLVSVSPESWATMPRARPSPSACHVPHLLLDTGALKTTEEKAEVPSLDKEGWPRPLRKCREASLAGADGVVGSSHRLSEVERTTPFLMFRPTGLTLRAAPPKERDHLLDGAATPPLPRSQGVDFAFPADCPRRPRR